MEGKQIKKKIGTHSGQFHTDEALATAMLINFTQEFQNAEIIRTRDLSVLEKVDIAVDVGGKYDPNTNRYDHHQKEFQDTFNQSSNIRLSSAGLIYKHFGKEILSNAIKYLSELEKDFNICAEMMQKKMQEDQKLFEIAHQNIYDSFIKAVDAGDNGINQYDGQEPKFAIHTSLQSRVSRLNIGWNIKNGALNPDEQFKKAMDICKFEFLDQVRAVVFDNLPGRPIVEEAIKNRMKCSNLGTILYLDPFCPWKEHLLDLEQEMQIADKIQFIIFKDNTSNGFRVQGVPETKATFTLRTPLKSEWRGITDIEKLKSISGIQDVVFCHANGFIGGAQSMESCIKMAELSLQQNTQ